MNKQEMVDALLDLVNRGATVRRIDGFRSDPDDPTEMYYVQMQLTDRARTENTNTMNERTAHADRQLRHGGATRVHPDVERGIRGGQFREQILPIPSKAPGPVSDIRLAEAAEALSRFPGFRVQLSTDKDAWVASVDAVYGSESVYYEAKWSATDIRLAVIELFDAMRRPFTYVAFRENACANYAIRDGNGGWTVRTREDVQASGDESATDGVWSRLRPAFMKPGYVWPGPVAGDPRQVVSEATSA